MKLRPCSSAEIVRTSLFTLIPMTCTMVASLIFSHPHERYPWTSPENFMTNFPSAITINVGLSGIFHLEVQITIQELQTKPQNLKLRALVLLKRRRMMLSEIHQEITITSSTIVYLYLINITKEL